MPLPRAEPHKKRILIVDDDPDSAELVAHVLRPHYELVIAKDGAEGADLAAQFPPDLVITDVDMPRVGGLTMARHLRARQGLKAPIIFLSAAGSPRDVIAGISAGARYYLTKPVDMMDLKKRVAHVLGA